MLKTENQKAGPRFLTISFSTEIRSFVDRYVRIEIGQKANNAVRFDV